MDIWIPMDAVLCLVTQLYLTLCDSMDCSPLGSPVHGSLQARILEWVAMPSSRGSSQPGDRIQVSCIAGRFLWLSPDGSPRILEWVTYYFSRGSSWPRNQTGVSWSAGRFFTSWATREAHNNGCYNPSSI